MARPSATSRARRTLLWTTALVVALVLGLAAAVQFGTASWKPKLALDLAGGTEIILTPQVRPGQGTITNQTITDAIAIIRQRVDSSGSTEAEVASQGGRNIVVSLPGDPAEQKRARALVSQSAQMRFRPVLVAGSAAPAAPTPSASPSATPSPATSGATPAPSGSAPATPTPTATASQSPGTSAPTSSTQGDRVPQALLAAGATPSAAASATPAAPSPVAATPSASAPAPAASTPAAPKDPSDLSQVTPQLQAQFEALDCSNPVAVGTGLRDDPRTPVVTCDSRKNTAKYILGPVEVEGTDISGASAGLGQNSTGASTGQWVVNLSLDGKGRREFAATSTRLYGYGQSDPRNQFAIVLDGTVVSAPSINNPITDGRAQISGSFTEASATQLANQLKFGALPISFHVQSEEQVSALLGSEQLQRGLLAGLIGLLLVVVYSLAQYRLLGLVTVGSLLVAGVISFLATDLLSWYQGYRLSLAGVAGFIVSIGITADSFIVFFERVRDEVREGRSLNTAVESGWVRARRTIIISDAVNFLAAATLYVLAVGSVRGFAFTLGLTTLVDLVVVVGFTHPVVVLLARRPFFAQGRKLSGFDAEHLGRALPYAGRGRVRTPGERRAGIGAGAPAPVPVPAGATALEPGPAGRGTIAERRAEREAAQRDAERQSAGAPAGALAGRTTPTDEER